MLLLCFGAMPAPAGQGNLVGAAHLHALGGDFPDGVVEVELRPFSHAQFAGPRHYVGRNLHGQSRDRMAGIGVNRAQKLAHLLGIKDRRVMFDLRHDQRAAQDRAGIALPRPVATA